MKNIALLVMLFLCSTSYAQQVFPTYRVSDEAAPDTVEVQVIQLNEITAVASYKFGDDTARYRFNQMKYYMKTVYPYAMKAVALFDDIDTKIQNMDGAEKRKYIKSREAEIKREFEDKMRTLNSTQGKYLVRMINRNANRTCYDIVSYLHNPLKAAGWQTWARMNGMDLNEQYKAEHYKQFERVMLQLEYQ
jgi:hypothetical protein